MLKKITACLAAALIFFNLILPFSAEARMPAPPRPPVIRYPSVHRPPSPNHPAPPPGAVRRPPPPYRQKPSVRRPPNVPNYHKKLPAYKIKHKQREKTEYLKDTAKRSVRDYQFKYSGRQYTHGFYRAYYKSRLHVMHSNNWITLLGLDKFTKMIDENKMQKDNTVILDEAGKIIGLKDNNLSQNSVVLDQNDKPIPVIHEGSKNKTADNKTSNVHKNDKSS